MVFGTRRARRLALRMTWRSHLVGGDDVATVYWFPTLGRSTPDVERALGVSGLPRDSVGVVGTRDEIAGWIAAAASFVDEVVAAAAELHRVESRTSRWRGRPVVRRWAEATYDEAKACYLDRVRAASSRYQPVRDVVEEQIAERETARLAAAERAQQERERQTRKAEARFQAWERRSAVADRPLPGGFTPRQLAARGDNPTRWPQEVEARVGDLATWWAGVRMSARNEQARAEAVRTVIEAITATAAALEKARRPGLSAADEGPREVLYGWWVDFTWSHLPGVERLRTPPDIPVGHLRDGKWDYDLYLPRRMLFTRPHSTAVSPGDYLFATVTNERVGNSDNTRPAWWKRDIAEFANDLFPVTITYRERYPRHTAVRTRIADHADPAVFIPYIQAVARRTAVTFQALVPGPK